MKLNRKVRFTENILPSSTQGPIQTQTWGFYFIWHHLYHIAFSFFEYFSYFKNVECLDLQSIFLAFLLFIPDDTIDQPGLRHPTWNSGPTTDVHKHPVFNFKRPKKILLASIYNRGTKQQLLQQAMQNLHKSGKESQI